MFFQGSTSAVNNVALVVENIVEKNLLNELHDLFCLSAFSSGCVMLALCSREPEHRLMTY